MNIIFLGAPGSGKGTQAEAICQKFNFVKISLGDLIRDEIESNSMLGNEISSFVKQGLLVPDNLIFSLFNSFKMSADLRYLIDGFPRTLAQAEFLSGFMKNLSRHFVVVYFDIELEKLIVRLANRVVCGKCKRIFSLLSHPADGVCIHCNLKLVKREDDSEEVVRKRLEVYVSETSPILEYYFEKLIRINADCSQSEVTSEIISIIEGDICV